MRFSVNFALGDSSAFFDQVFFDQILTKISPTGPLYNVKSNFQQLFSAATFVFYDVFTLILVKKWFFGGDSAFLNLYYSNLTKPNQN